MILDLATARETGRLTLEPGTLPMGGSRDGRTLAFLQGLPRSDRFPFERSKVWLVDPAGPVVVATLDTGTWRYAPKVSDHLFLLDPGRRDKNPEKNKNATVEVVALAERRITPLDAGWGLEGIIELGDRVILASDGRPGGSAGELRVLRADSFAATIEVAEKPRLVEEAAGVVYVVGSKAVTLVDPETLQVTGTIPLAKSGQAIVDADDRPTEMAVADDGQRAFILYGANNKVAVLDLGQKRAIGSAKTGRGGKKLFNKVLPGLGMAGGFYYSSGAYSVARHREYMMRVRPDGRFAYALNFQTKDVTVVDGNTGEAVAAIGADGYNLEMFGGLTVVAVGSALHFIDAERNVKTEELRLSRLRGLLPSPDRACAVALADRTVLILDGATGKERARLTDFDDPIRIAFTRAGPIRH